MKLVKHAESKPKKKKTAQNKVLHVPYLGIQIRKKSGDRLIISAVLSGTPAAEHGLYANDEIIALDGYRITHSQFKDQIRNRKTGQTIRLTVFRDNKMLEIPVKLGQVEHFRYRIIKKQKATAFQKQIFKGWTGADYRSWKEKDPPVNPRARITNSIV